MKKTITIALLLASCLAVTTLATAQDSTSQQYMAENERILAQRDPVRATNLAPAMTFGSPENDKYGATA